MPIYKPSELQQFLLEMGITPRKGLSQNFLIDGNILKKIVKTANVENGDFVLEIGPGPGSLTEELLNAGAEVLAVEKDAALAKALERYQRSPKGLQIACEDIMDFPLEEALKEKLVKGQKAKVIANLPYHLTTPIIARLITMNEQISTLVLMVQDEVARRFTASPGTSAYSSFTVFLNFFSKPSYAFKVSRHCFYPEPGVDSAVVMLTLKKPPELSNQDQFFKVTRTAFEHRRKMLRASLKELYPPEAIMETLKKIGQDPQARPEVLSLDEFLRFFEILQAKFAC